MRKSRISWSKQKKLCEHFVAGTSAVDKLNGRIEHKRPIAIIGSSGSSWETVSTEHRRDIEIAIDMLVESMDPKKVYFTQGRVKPEGIGKILDDAIEAHNSKQEDPENRFDVLGVVSRHDKNPKLARNIDYILPFDKQPENISEKLVPFLADAKGYAIYIGGKKFTSDAIELSKTHLDGRFLVMKGPKGAASAAANTLFDKRRFSDSKEMFAKMVEMSGFKGLLKDEIDVSDPSKIDKIYMDAKASVALRHYENHTPDHSSIMHAQQPVVTVGKSPQTAAYTNKI